MDDEKAMIDLHTESGRRWITAALVGVALLSAAYWTEAVLLRWRQAMPEATRASNATGRALPAAALSALSAPSMPPTPPVPPAEALARLLGAQPRVPGAAPGPADRFKVLGVIASASGRGAALVAVDGQPARTYSVGAALAPGFVLRSVSQKEITLAARPGGQVLATLPLPEPGSTAIDTNPDRTTAPGATAAPPIVSGSRGNPRSPEPAANPAAGASAPPPSPLQPSRP
jgi:general secretion pathway protein C